MKKVLLLLPTGFELLEAGAFTDVFGWARVVFKQDVQTVSCGIARDRVVRPAFRNEASLGTDDFNDISMFITCDTSVYNAHVYDFAALAIPGGFGRYSYFEEGSDPQALQLIREFDAQKKPIAAICTGALLLAKSGILEGKEATSYRLEGGKYIKQLANHGAIVGENSELVIAGHIITSDCPGSAPAASLALLSMLTSEDEAGAVRKAMGFGAAKI